VTLRVSMFVLAFPVMLAFVEYKLMFIYLLTGQEEPANRLSTSRVMSF